MKEWEIWFAEFPYEENPAIVKKRPVIIINVERLEVLSVKVTSQNIRDCDKYDTPIVHWQEAGLDRESVARVSKTLYLTPDKFMKKFGVLHSEDQATIAAKYVEYVSAH